jgi:hypothetical protein
MLNQSVLYFKGVTMMENLSTQEHAERIAESVTNGQHKQALNQFNEALRDHCNIRALVCDMESAGLPCEKITLLLCNIIEKV